VNVLVDTTVWSLALRRKGGALGEDERAIVEELAELIREGRAKLIGIVRQELLSGIKLRTQFEQLRARLRAFPDEALTIEDFEVGAEAGNSCRGRGVAVSLADMLICAIAMRRDWTVFTRDADFAGYAKVLGLKLHAARGM